MQLPPPTPLALFSCPVHRWGAYLLLSALTCFALDVVTGPQQVARLPDPKQLQEVRAAAERRKSMANLQLRRAAERALRSKASSLGECDGATVCMDFSKMWCEGAVLS